MANTYGFDPVAWSVDGGRHRGELLRVLAYAATGGAEGIVSPGDCKVRQLAVPGAQVAMDPGALLIRNRSANVRNQTYAANGRTETRLDVTATGSTGGRNDLIIVRVEDPQYSPWAQPSAGDAPDFQYVKPFIIENVPANTRSAKELNLGYSAYALARLDIPASTSTITTDMIKDLRELAQPRSLARNYGGPGPASATYTAGQTGGDQYGMFPLSSIRPSVQIPEWATHVDITGQIISIVSPDAQSSGASLVKLGSLYGPHLNYDYSDDLGGWNNLKTLAATMIGSEIPAAMRGTTQELTIRARLDFGRLQLQPWSAVLFNVAFYERAV